MNKRQAFALAHPLNDTTDFDLLTRLCQTETLPSGDILRTVLAIDR